MKTIRRTRRRWESRTEWLTHEDLIDIRMRKGRPSIDAFSVNLRSWIQGRWCTVLRVDTAHGRLHRHRFWLPHPRRLQDLEPHHGGPRDRTAQLGAAVQEVRRQWHDARRQMARRIKEKTQ